MDTATKIKRRAVKGDAQWFKRNRNRRLRLRYPTPGELNAIWAGKLPENEITIAKVIIIKTPRDGMVAMAMGTDLQPTTPESVLIEFCMRDSVYRDLAESGYVPCL